MKKKVLIYGGISIVLIVLVVIMLVSTNSKVIDKDSLSEIEKYALFHADLTCRLAEYKTSNMWQAMEELPLMAEEYGYSTEDLQYYQSMYEEDDEFWKFSLDYTKEMCPEVVEQMGII